MNVETTREIRQKLCLLEKRQKLCLLIKVALTHANMILDIHYNYLGQYLGHSEK